MIAIFGEATLAALSFLGASYVWLFAVPKLPSFDGLGITFASSLFESVGLYFAYRACRAGWRSAILLLLIVAAGQALVVYHILTTPFFKI